MRAEANTLLPEARAKELGAVRIGLLGGFSVTVGNRKVDESTWRLRKAASLIKLLALAPGHRLHRERAMDLLLRVREPDFDEHRMLRTPEKDVHVHVFSAGSAEIERYLLLRERLRQNEGDRELYAQTKRELAKQNWPTMEHYAEAKTEVVEDIIYRAAAARSSHDGVR